MIAMSQHQPRYPLLEIDLDQLHHNLALLTEHCQAHQIEMVGVVKGFHALPELVKLFDQSGFRYLATSRMDQLRAMQSMDLQTPLMLLRVPMLSELGELVALAEQSLHSEYAVLQALEIEAARQGKRHKVILMADLGDLREGFWDKDELVEVATAVERQMPHLELTGIGTNLGCYGSVLPTTAKMDELLELAERIEQAIGRKLEVISGGASSSVYLLQNGAMPRGINQLRLGELALLGRMWNCEMPGMYTGALTLKAEVIECRDKPTYPVGELGMDALSRVGHYVDRGIRKRALVALGRVDYGDPSELKPRMGGIEVLGASSDHTILDVAEAAQPISVGSILEFDLCYATMIFLTNTPSVQISFKGGHAAEASM